ncbi:MarR family winged helix-turn-helix transcriptional regulator [Microlunatus sagamiharensis]|uniref:MarR family winged helix-turn-helix transcriptional regulator n=1 Tax=Microlunatus sagamiharensis TaxID=546874 RepID=UPI0018D461F1|nr:MarR family winged helix-turn-helix transcriptional regulator [Microlunatus sagamiharensis]
MPASLEHGSDVTDAAGVFPVDGTAETVAEAARKLRALIMAGERYRTALASSTGLGTTESQAIGYLFVHGSRGQSDLARDLGLTSSAATALVDRLERRGVAARTRHANDRRRLLVSLTEYGEALAVRSQEPLLDTLNLVPASDLEIVATWLGVMADHLQARSS